MADFWTIETGQTIATVEEETTVSIGLPLVPNTNPSLKIISGELPPGLRLKDNQIIGTPYQVNRTQTFSFVIRATVDDNVEDRTYRIIVNGPDSPVWTTPEGILKAGGDNPLNNRYFILDNEVVDFQLMATDDDFPTGETLEFYIDKGDGVLPPGITLSKTGKLSGVVEPLLALDKDSKLGQYDTGNYDMYLHDFSNVSSLFYQGQVIQNYIYNPPKKLNRYYEFRVSVTDGYTIVKRNFILYVVGEDFLRADNVIIQVGTGVFTADNTYIRWPIWVTPPDLGYRRANNYITLFLDVLKNENQRGAIQYELLTTNDDNTSSQVPPGMALDVSTGEVAGRVGYQPAVTREYKFTVRANLILSENNVVDVVAYRDRTFTVKLLGDIDSKITWLTQTNLGTIPANFGSVFRVEASTTVADAPLIYTLAGGRLPPGLTLQYNGEITGKVVQFGDSEKDGLTIFDNDDLTFDGDTTSVDRIYKFTAEAKDRFGYSAETKEFSIEVIDDDDRQYSNLYMKPFLKEDKRDRFSQYINDPANFPPSLVYRPNDPNYGLQRDIKILAYAGIETSTLEQVFGASQKWHKKRRYRIGDVKSAVAKTPGTQNEVYEIIYLEIIDPAKPTEGTARNSFVIKNNQKITADTMTYDTNRKYTNQQEGYPTLTASGDTTNRNNEQYKFTTSDTQLDLGDTVLSEDGSTILTATANTDSDPFKFGERNAPKADDGGFLVSGGGGKKYLANIDNMQNSIKTLGRTEYDFLPLWMRTPQESGTQEPGFVLAIPLCYLKPGNSQTVLTNLKNSSYDLKDLDLEIDRYLIDSTTGNSNEQYVLFNNFAYNA
jgi:hypothetical protein